MKHLRNIIPITENKVGTLKTQYHAGHPEHEKEVARASKESGIHPDKVKKMIHNMNNTKIHWDADKKKEKEAADLAYENPNANTIKYASKNKPKSPAVIAMKKFREG